MAVTVKKQEVKQSELALEGRVIKLKSVTDFNFKGYLELKAGEIKTIEEAVFNDMISKIPSFSFAVNRKDIQVL